MYTIHVEQAANARIMHAVLMNTFNALSQAPTSSFADPLGLRTTVKKTSVLDVSTLSQIISQQCSWDWTEADGVHSLLCISFLSVLSIIVVAACHLNCLKVVCIGRSCHVHAQFSAF